MPPKWPSRGILNQIVLRDATQLNSRIASKCDLHQTRSQYADITPLRKQLKDATKQTRRSPTAGRKSGTSDCEVSAWKLTVGIEIHAQLNTIRKLFSRARPEQENNPNSNLAPFDIAIPGSQPVFELSAVVPALRAALALNCNIERASRFDRKHYFYHDQPSGYQITQYYEPFARNGSVLITSDDGLSASDGTELVVGIKQIQLEQDTAKTQEQEDGTSMIDFTRSGQPLIEIISLPHIHSPEAAAAYLRKVQAILSSVDSVTTGMEFGGLRADVNVSVQRLDAPTGSHSYAGVKGLGQRTEIKNLSSFKAVEDAVKAERDRQISTLEKGGTIQGETRGWSQSSPNETRRLRGKEGEVDYRYMPDPDIPPLFIGNDLVSYLRQSLPPVPEQLVAMLMQEYGLSSIDAKALVALDHGERMVYFQDVVALIPESSVGERLANGKTAGNWVLHELGALLSISERAWSPDMVPAQSLARILELQSNGKITGPTAKQLLRILFDSDNKDVDETVTRESLWFQSMSTDELQDLARSIIEAHADTAASIRQGNHKKIQFLVGQIMRSNDRGRIDAKQAGEMVRNLLLST